MLIPKIILSPKILLWPMKFCIQKTFGSNETLCLQNVEEEKNSVQNDLDKCHQDKCCLDTGQVSQTSCTISFLWT